MAKRKSKPTVVDVLKRMRVLLRRGWTQGYYAHSKTGRQVEFYSKSAARFCLIGAEHRALTDLNAHDLGLNRPVQALIAKCAKVPRIEIVAYNDNPKRKKSEILQVVNCAIKTATATTHTGEK